MEQFYWDADLQQRLSEEGRKTAQAYTYRRVAERLVEIYEIGLAAAKRM
jgi:hypothetical protein